MRVFRVDGVWDPAEQNPSGEFIDRGSRYWKLAMVDRRPYWSVGGPFWFGCVAGGCFVGALILAWLR